MFTASGSCGAIEGAKIALATIVSKRAAAAIPHLRRTRRRRDPRDGADAAGRAAPRAGLTATSAPVRAAVTRSPGSADR